MSLIEYKEAEFEKYCIRLILVDGIATLAHKNIPIYSTTFTIIKGNGSLFSSTVKIDGSQSTLKEELECETRAIRECLVNIHNVPAETAKQLIASLLSQL